MSLLPYNTRSVPRTPKSNGLPSPPVTGTPDREQFPLLDEDGEQFIYASSSDDDRVLPSAVPRTPSSMVALPLDPQGHLLRSRGTATASPAVYIDRDGNPVKLFEENTPVCSVLACSHGAHEANMKRQLYGIDASSIGQSYPQREATVDAQRGVWCRLSPSFRLRRQPTHTGLMSTQDVETLSDTESIWLGDVDEYRELVPLPLHMPTFSYTSTFPCTLPF